jgi:inorganic phosphate transporter, PiT family
VIGATVIASGFDAVQGVGVISKVLIPAVLAPITAVFVATVGTYLVYSISRRVSDDVRDRGFRFGQIGSASLVSLAHGTNDAQKTMGVITLALIANHTIGANADVPLWVILSCATAISLGTFLGGWRVIRTLGKGLVEIEPPQGFAAEGSSAAVILASSHLGYPLSTTHVCTGSVVGSGIGKRLAEVRWSVAARMGMAWVLTIPAAAVVGGLAFKSADLIGGATGVGVVFAIAIAGAAAIFALAQKAPINSSNVNDDWPGDKAKPRERVAASA